MNEFLGAMLLMAESIQIGTWMPRTQTDAMTDRVSESSVVFADNGMISIKCDPDNKVVYAMVASLSYLGGRGIYTDQRRVAYRFDDLGPIEAKWVYKDKWAAMRPDSPDRKGFFAYLRNADRLRVRVTTYDLNYVDMDFKVTGAADQIDRVAASCGDATVGP